MPLNFVDVSTEPDFNKTDGEVIRQTLADCLNVVLKPETSGIRCYPYWIYEIDGVSLLGKITAPMRVTSGTEKGKLHAWTIGISQFDFERNPNSGHPFEIGGRNNAWRWLDTIDIWGFLEDDGTGVAQKAMENETRLVAAQIWRNAPIILENVPKMSEFRPPVFSVSKNPFSTGENVYVASGSLNIFVRESISIQEGA